MATGPKQKRIDQMSNEEYSRYWAAQQRGLREYAPQHYGKLSKQSTSSGYWNTGPKVGGGYDKPAPKSGGGYSWWNPAGWMSGEEWAGTFRGLARIGGEYMMGKQRLKDQSKYSRQPLPMNTPSTTRAHSGPLMNSSPREKRLLTELAGRRLARGVGASETNVRGAGQDGAGPAIGRSTSGMDMQQIALFGGLGLGALLLLKK